ncbi:MAG: hypothetical protein ACOH2N_14335 [Devosia sp.]
MNKILLAAVATLALSGAAFAETAVAAPEFATVDTDANGTVSLVEAQAVMPELTAEAFTAVDLDANGELSVEEFDALVAARAAM